MWPTNTPAVQHCHEHTQALSWRKSATTPCMPFPPPPTHISLFHRHHTCCVSSTTHYKHSLLARGKRYQHQSYYTYHKPTSTSIYIPSLATTSTAARVRLVAKSREAARIVDFAFAPPDEDDHLLVPRTEPWHFHTTVHHARTTLQSHPTTIRQHQRDKASQAQLIATLQPDLTAAIRKHVEKRLQRWHPELPQDKISGRATTFLANLQHAPRNIPPGHRWTTFRIVSNAANTSRRFQQTPLHCLWCKAPNQDALDHLPFCPAVPHITRAHLPHLHDIPLTTDLFFMTMPLSPTVVGSVICLHDLLNAGMVARLHGKHPIDPHTTLFARTKTILRRHPALHAYLRI